MWCAMLIGPGFRGNSSQSLSKDSNEPDNKSDKSSSDILPNKPKLHVNKEHISVDKFCRRCGHIVLKRHHHCPWINSCVGLENERYFIKFLYLTLATSIQAIPHLIVDCLLKESLIILNIVNIGLSAGVFIGVAVLLYEH